MTYPTAAEVQEHYAELASIRSVAQRLGVSYGYVQARLKMAASTPPAEPLKPGVHIFTCEQNNTKLHAGFWQNLQAYAARRDARIHVSRFTYDLSSYDSHKVKPGTAREKEPVWFNAETQPYVDSGSTEVTPGLVWCAELNLLPTAVRPLSGMMTYTRDDSAIIPHPKMALESAPTLSEQPRFVMTTGACTVPNYIAKKAGQKAEFHHIIGALVVEVLSHGGWTARHINAEADGSFHDTTWRYSGGRHEWVRAKAIIAGDIHAEQLDDKAAEWLRHWVHSIEPEHLVLHDVLDFRARNHHRRNDPHERFERHVRGESSVTEDIAKAAEVLRRLAYEGMKIHAVQSNHDEAFYRWLREADFRQDPENALLYLRANLEVYETLAEHRELPPPLMLAFKAAGQTAIVNHVGVDESLEIAGVECGMHGHYGPNGVKGSAQALLTVGKKVVIGHTHTARIADGVFSVGVTGKLRMGYNKGPSAWSHTHCVIYQNGKRALLLPIVRKDK